MSNLAQYGYPAGTSIVDTIPDNIKHLVHPHWAKYPPVNPMWIYIIGVWYVAMGIASFIGNGTVIYLYFKCKKLRTPANLLVLNLATLDFLMLMLNFPIFSYNCFVGGYWALPDIMCTFFCIAGGTTGMGSLWSHVFITLDRYNVIVHGVAGKPLTHGKAALTVLFIWVYSFAVTTPPLYGWGIYNLEGIMVSCSFDYLTRDWNNRSFGTFLVVFCYCIPLAIILYAYIHIFKAVVAHEAAMKAQAKKMNVSSLKAQSGNEESAEMRVAKTAVINVTIWILCWTPYCAIVVQAMWFDQTNITPLVTMVPAVFAKAGAVYSPMIYALSHPKFRTAMQENVSWCCVHEPEGQSDKDNGSKSNAGESA